MRLPELKNISKINIQSVLLQVFLIVALAGTGVSTYSVAAAKNTTATEQTESTEKETTTEDSGEEDSDSSLLSDVLDKGLKVSQKDIGKDETVYVISNSVGNPEKVIVSDHLVNNDNKDTIEDASNLTDITNVKGDETFTQNGSKVTWDAQGSDIYYQGTSDEELPVTQKITYYLDGTETTPEELAGKSGKVTIRFDYTNNKTVEATIDGKKENINVPFVAISGMILDDSFSNIEVTNGKVMADGNNSVVFGYALPGLADSLDVDEDDFDEDVSIPEYFEVTADVENFSLDMTMTVVANATTLLIPRKAMD